MAVDGGSADSGDAGSDGGAEGGAEQAGSQSGADPIANLGPDGAAETAGPAPDQPVDRTHDPMGDLTDPAADGGFDGSVFEQPPPVDPDGEPAWLLPTEFPGARGSAISTLPAADLAALASITDPDERAAYVADLDNERGLA